MPDDVYLLCLVPGRLIGFGRKANSKQKWIARQLGVLRYPSTRSPISANQKKTKLTNFKPKSIFEQPQYNTAPRTEAGPGGAETGELTGGAGSACLLGPVAGAVAGSTRSGRRRSPYWAGRRWLERVRRAAGFAAGKEREWGRRGCRGGWWWRWGEEGKVHAPWPDGQSTRRTRRWQAPAPWWAAAYSVLATFAFPVGVGHGPRAPAAEARADAERVRDNRGLADVRNVHLYSQLVHFHGENIGNKKFSYVSKGPEWDRKRKMRMIKWFAPFCLRIEAFRPHE